jgi:hypothetical protein
VGPVVRLEIGSRQRLREPERRDHRQHGLHDQSDRYDAVFAWIEETRDEGKEQHRPRELGGGREAVDPPAAEERANGMRLSAVRWRCGLPHPCQALQPARDATTAK